MGMVITSSAIGVLNLAVDFGEVKQDNKAAFAKARLYSL